ncbi:MAG: hypothetical protein ACOCQQ_03700 [Candidatus Nanoarchaeia archaeon]
MISKQIVLQFKKSADTIYALKDFTSATTLYFKTLFALQDFMLLTKIGYAPKDHGERFRLLEKEFPKHYEILDLEFNTYRSTYNRTISKDTCDRIKQIVEDEFAEIFK